MLDMNIGQKQQLKETIQLNLEKRLEQIKLKKYGMEIKKKKSLELNILD